MFAAFLKGLLYALDGAIVAFLLYGFWQGLSLRPNAPENRCDPQPSWWTYWWHRW